MYNLLQKLLADQTGGKAFKCFDIYHLCFIAFFVASAIFLCLNLKNKSGEKRKKIINLVIGIAFGVYMADFFLMPFAYGTINIDKLPFHICTTMCVACFFSRHNAFWGRFRLQFAMLGFLSNLTYLCYPAGMMWMGIHPLSYRVVQTLIFHGVMMNYGLLVLVYERQAFSWKKIYKDFGVTAVMTAWAWLGNTLYSNQDGVVYNWFFVSQDPFGAFPVKTAPFIMPFLNTALFFGVGLVVYWIIYKAAAWKKSKEPAKI